MCGKEIDVCSSFEVHIRQEGFIWELFEESDFQTKREKMRELFEELLRYLYLLAKHVSNDDRDENVTLSPSLTIDQVLHPLLLKPMLYAEICDALLDMNHKFRESYPLRCLPHNPLGSEDGRFMRDARLKKTYQEYEQTFGTKPPDFYWLEEDPWIVVSKALLIPDSDNKDDKINSRIVKSGGDFITIHFVTNKPISKVSLKVCKGITASRVCSIFDSIGTYRLIYDGDRLMPDTVLYDDMELIYMEEMAARARASIIIFFHFHQINIYYCVKRPSHDSLHTRPGSVAESLHLRSYIHSFFLM